MNEHNPRHLRIALAALVWGGLGTVWGQEGEPAPGRGTVGEVTPAHVTTAHALQQVMVIHADLELIRKEMGKPQGQEALLQVEDAKQRDLFFQALTLFRKANRLSFENARRKAQDPEIPVESIRPEHVHRILDLARERIELVKDSLEIDEAPQVPPLEEGAEPTQVFAQIVDANRAINGLLDKRFAPSDVFEQVTVAIAYTSRLLAATGELNSLPDEPLFEHRKRPAEVYQRLLNCFEKIRQVAEISGVPILKLVNNGQQLREVEPSDVYDLSGLLVAELAYFQSQVPDAAAPRKTYNPGRKLPSHVYQRAGMLLEQLDLLVRRAQQNPGWLGEPNEPPPAQP